MQNSCKMIDQRSQISTRTTKFHFLVKNAVFLSKTKMIFLKNAEFNYKWFNDHIQQVFQIAERSDQYSRRYGILKSYPFEIAQCSIISIQKLTE